MSFFDEQKNHRSNNEADPDRFVSDSWQANHDAESEDFADQNGDVDFANFDGVEASNVVEHCWRCQKEFEASELRCPFCSAKNRSLGEIDGALEKTSSLGAPAIVKTVWAFIALAVTSVFLSFVSSFEQPGVIQGTVEWAQQLLIWIGATEVVGTIIVLISLSLITLNVEWPESNGTWTVWVAAIPLLATAIGLNLGFHFVLRNVLQIPVEDVLLFQFPELLPWCILLICVQPAIVEELFFRQIALGASLEVMSVKSAVMISSLLFAMAHLGNPLSMPYLAVLGAMLAWLRLKSGGLLLPMIFHFAHNLIVVTVL